MEYSFRNAVLNIGLQFRNVSDFHGRGFLEHWKASSNLEPSFQIGAPFGIKHQEKTQQGHVIVRKGSSKFYNEESIERMFERVCSRQKNSNLKRLFESLECGISESARLAIWSDSIEQILSKSGANFTVVPTPIKESEFKAKMYSALFHLETREQSMLIVSQDGQIYTDEVGIRILNLNLSDLKKQLIKEQVDQINF